MFSLLTNVTPDSYIHYRATRERQKRKSRHEAALTLLELTTCHQVFRASQAENSNADAPQAYRPGAALSVTVRAERALTRYAAFFFFPM